MSMKYSRSEHLCNMFVISISLTDRTKTEMCKICEKQIKTNL